MRSTNIVLDWVQHRFSDKSLNEATLNVKDYYEKEVSEAVEQLKKDGYKVEIIEGNYLKVSK